MDPHLIQQFEDWLNDYLFANDLGPDGIALDEAVYRGRKPFRNLAEDYILFFQNPVNEIFRSVKQLEASCKLDPSILQKFLDTLVLNENSKNLFPGEIVTLDKSILNTTFSNFTEKDVELFGGSTTVRHSFFERV